MVTKWKNKSRKICENRKGCVLLWTAIFFSLALFFAGFGIMAGDVGDLSDVPGFLGRTKYTDSQMHREDVVAAFEEVKEKAVTEKGAATQGWKFKGMYDFIIQRDNYFFLHQTNISDAEYEKYMKSQESAEDGIEQLGEDDKGQEKEKEYRIRESREIAEWYFKKNMKCYYIWNNGVFKAGSAAYGGIEKELDLTDSYTNIAIGFTERQLEEGQHIIDSIHRHVLSGMIIMFAGILAAFFCLSTLILGGTKSFGRRFDNDVCAAVFIAAIFTMISFGRTLLEGYGDENVIGYVAPRAGMLGIMSVLAVGALYVAVCNIRTNPGREGFLSYRLWKKMRSAITGENYYTEGIQVCSKKRQKFVFRLLMIPLVIVWGSMGIYLIGGMTGFYSIPADFLVDSMIVGVLGMIPYLFVAFAVIRLYKKGTERILEEEYVKLMGQMDELSRGNYQGGRLLGETSVFARESWKMSMLGCQMQENVHKKIQAEKMKIDLITNVSHDLKTPLTSIISYIDLLSKEELSPVAKDYIQVIEKKSERLKKMIADVFDLSRASSGNLEIRKEKLDFNKLLVQVLADMDQDIKEAPVKVAREISKNTGMIKSDGEKLYRVFQNIMNNALKYSMPGTRIYVTLKVQNRRVSVCIKNVSAYEMNFTKEEVLGRFFRGDKARSTEGSGLGLAIAKEFTEVCGGKLDLRIDGDVFVVEVDFPCCDVVMVQKDKKKE